MGPKLLTGNDFRCSSLDAIDVSNHMWLSVWTVHEKQRHICKILLAKNTEHHMWTHLSLSVWGSCNQTKVSFLCSRRKVHTDGDGFSLWYLSLPFREITGVYERKKWIKSLRSTKINPTGWLPPDLLMSMQEIWQTVDHS